MKIRIIAGSAAIVTGLLIALGPQFLFKVCEVVDDMKMKCFWTARAEIGVGALIAAFGIALLFFTHSKTQLGLNIGIILSAILALLFPHALIGGCPMHTMPCRMVTFPAITVISILVIISGLLYTVYLLRKKD
jgi:hypothetical protein